MSDLKRRNLSGIYFRVPAEDGNPLLKWENVVFEDLPTEEQDHQMVGRDKKWLKSLAKSLAQALRRVGEQFDLTRIDDANG